MATLFNLAHLKTTAIVPGGRNFSGPRFLGASRPTIDRTTSIMADAMGRIIG